MRLPSPLAAALMAALLTAGCGGEKSDRDRLADDVNEICRDLEESLRGLEQARSLRRIGVEGKRLIPAVDRAGQRLARVKAPREVKRELGDDYIRFVATFRAQAIAYGAIVGAAEKGDERSVRTLAGQLDQLDRANDARARKLGFDDCD